MKLFKRRATGGNGGRAAPSLGAGPPAGGDAPAVADWPATPVDARLSPEALAGMMAAVGLGPAAGEVLLRGARPAVRFAVRPGPTDPVRSVGLSRFGGSPDLPDDVEWPVWTPPGGDGSPRPLSFFTQIALAGLAAGTDLPLPDHGLLLFFCDFDNEDDEGILGLYADEHEGSRVLHVPTSGLRRRHGPTGTHTYPESPLLPVLATTVPEADDLALDDDGWEALDALNQEMEQHVRVRVPDGWRVDGRQQLGGHARFIQHPVEQEALQAAAGVYRRDSGFDQVLWAQVKAEAAHWRLLFQLDSDDDLDVMWGDVGTLYWVARFDHLAEAAWDQVWFNFQCS